MWPEIYNFVTIALSVSLCSAAVKLMDDYLDKDIDLSIGRKNWAEILGRGTMVYAVLLLAFAAALHTQMALSLFFACYIVGMFTSLSQRLPSSLKSWQESFLVFILGSWFLSWHIMLFALSFVFAVQLIDDCIDYQCDKRIGLRNFAHRFGVIECLLGALLSVLLAWSIDETAILPAITGTGIVYVTSFRYQEVKLWASNW
jgi:4-hydroxybenzoate polyprenyltransferase